MPLPPEVRAEVAGALRKAADDVEAGRPINLVFTAQRADEVIGEVYYLADSLSGPALILRILLAGLEAMKRNAVGKFGSGMDITKSN